MPKQLFQKSLISFILVCCVAVSAQAQYVCCDADGSGGVNIADVTYLVDYLFRGGDAPVPLLAADCNDDSQVNIADLTYLVDFLFRGGPAPCTGPSGSLIDHSACKSFEIKSDSTPPDLDCLEYEYDGASILSLKHVNTAFNCCPGEIEAEIFIGGNLITIYESEVYDSIGPCPCLCLYDLEMEIINLPPGEYTIMVNQLYLQGGAETHEFDIVLTSLPSDDSECITRDFYPWGYYQSPPVNYGECKSYGEAVSRDSVPSDQDCIDYQYDGQGVLSINHINAAFNCCLEDVNTMISIEENVITIEEVEYLDNGGCFCLCLYDLGYDITGLSPGDYTIHVIEPYRDPDDDPLEFSVGLTSTPTSGSFCVDRTHYPWGF